MCGNRGFTITIIEVISYIDNLSALCYNAYRETWKVEGIALVSCTNCEISGLCIQTRHFKSLWAYWVIIWWSASDYAGHAIL